MTKKEILDKYFNGLDTIESAEKTLHNAMDEYAKQECIEVLKMAEKQWKGDMDHGDCIVCYDEINGSSIHCSVEYFYNLYIQEKK